MKNLVLKQVGITMLAVTISTGAILPAVPMTVYANQVDFEVREVTELEKILAEEGITNAEMLEYSNYIKQEIAKQSTDERERVKAVQAVKKAIRYALDHLDIIPSQTVRDYLVKHGSTIMDSMDKVETFTRTAITTVLMVAGLPHHVADAVADFIVTFLI